MKLGDTRSSTLIGMVIGSAIVAGMALLSPRHVWDFVNLPGLIVVVGGTLAATLISRPARDVIRVIKAIRTLLRDEDAHPDTELEQLMQVAYWHRLGNVAAAERALDAIQHPLLRTGAQMVIDREPIEDVANIMNWRIAGVDAREHADAEILRTMAGFAPAFGMLGTLFGLIHMLNGIGASGLSQIGGAMAFALITTLYGIVLANLFLKPLAIKMEQRAQQRLLFMQVLTEAVVMLHNRRHPALMREALHAYLLQHQVRDAQPPLLKAA